MADTMGNPQHKALPLTVPAHTKFRLPHLSLSGTPDLAHRRTEKFSQCAMTTISIRATYTEQTALDAFFGRLFGYGKASVLWKRGRFHCTLPRKLSAVRFTPASVP
ncbi:hypothetical protein FJTKL_12007 [Diaporthe vaccinii]|uniref:Uncharacterized protein n=1 Tax=Diaporthe vaccinii TaxID=105482 RepID=A0ABR4FAV0_9PEZI